MIPAGNLSGNASRAATVRAAPLVSDSGEHRNAATVRGIDSGMSRGQAVATVCRPLPMIPATSNAATVGRKCAAPPVSLSGKPWRPSASRHHRQTVRPVSDSGGQGFRDRSTVGRKRPPFDRGDRAPPVSGSPPPCDSRLFKAHKALSNFPPRRGDRSGIISRMFAAVENSRRFKDIQGS